MRIYAHYASTATKDGIKIFRYETTFCSKKGFGEPIGLVYMLNPGSARPISDELFERLQTSEYTTKDLVETATDPTMDKVIGFIKAAYIYNDICLPDRYTIHVENLFNLREDKSDLAKKIVMKLKSNQSLQESMFKSRNLISPYQFVWLAWGNNKINKELQQKIICQYPNAIKVHKLNYKGEIREVSYPVHPLYMNKEYFLEASEGKII